MPTRIVRNEVDTTTTGNFTIVKYTVPDGYKFILKNVVLVAEPSTFSTTEAILGRAYLQINGTDCRGIEITGMQGDVTGIYSGGGKNNLTTFGAGFVLSIPIPLGVEFVTGTVIKVIANVASTTSTRWLGVIIGVEEPATTYTVSLDSRQDNDQSVSRGSINLDGTIYGFPSLIDKSIGTHRARYIAPSGHFFVSWETSGGVSVSDPYANPTNVYVNGSGLLRAVYRVSTLPTGWSYRKSHVINPSSGAGADYQIRVRVHYGSGTDSGEDVYLNGKCRTDFGDVRFTGPDGSLLLHYWMESKVDGDNAVFWVKVADDLSTNPATIYIYYGNPNATYDGDPSTVFLVYDDFERSTINGGKYTYVIWNRRAHVETDEQDIRPGGVITSGYLKLNPDTMLYIAETLPANIAIKARVQHIGTATTRRNIVGARYQYASCIPLTGPGVGVAMGMIINGDQYVTPGRYIYDPQSGLSGTAIVSDTSLAPPSATWISVEIRLSQDKGYFYYQDSLWQIVTGLSYREGPVALFSSYDIHYFDDLIVRKFVDPEPSHGAWGSEESLVAVETIVAESFPMLYLSKPVTAQELVSKVEGATVTTVARDYPEILIKRGKSQELRSKFG